MSLSLVVLTNFYPAASQALDYAAALAARLQARLVLLHVKRASLFDPYLFAGDNWRQAELDAEAPTAEALHELMRQLPVPATLEMATDLLPEMAQSLATRYQPALFVLGLPATQTVANDDLSATALDLLRAGHHPLLLVPAGTTATVPPHHILLAADAEGFTIDASGRVGQQVLAALYRPITIAHVAEVADDDACALALHAVKKSGVLPVGTAGQSPDLRCVQHESIAAGILEAAHSVRAGLIVLLARQRSYLGELFHRSVTAQVLQRTTVPVLLLSAVPQPESAPEAEPPESAARHDLGGEVDGLLY